MSLRADLAAGPPPRRGARRVARTEAEIGEDSGGACTASPRACRLP
jgi:hypothetical protein